MDSLEIFFTVIDHPIKIMVLKFMEESEGTNVSFNELMDFFSIDCLSPERLLLVTSIWEMYNDQLLIKINHYSGTRFELTKRARELNKIITDFDYWLESHQFYGGV